MNNEHYIMVIAALAFVNVFTTFGWFLSFWFLNKQAARSEIFRCLCVTFKERFPIEFNSVEREAREKK